jgi:murein L,D-transpeptidase YcbB/YkuD
METLAFQIRRLAAPRAGRRRALLALAALALASAGACGPSRKELARRMDSVHAELARTLTGDDLPPDVRRDLEPRRSWQALRAFYGAEGAETVWVDGRGPRESADELIAVLGEGAEPGKDPSGAERAEAAGVARLVEMRDRARQAVEDESPELGRRLADFELAASYAFLTRAFHTLEGRVDPASLNVEWYTEGRKAEPLELLARVQGGAAPADVLADLEPKHQAYRRLLAARELYQAIVAAGGWPTVPAEGEALEEGARGPRVARLRQRLGAEGDLPTAGTGDEAPGPVFDAALAEAVRRFQERSGLAPDGKVGGDTLEALNVPAEERLRTIDLNLERWRWMPGTFGDHYVVVNIPEYRLRVIRGGATDLEMNVIVGKRFHETPVFSDTMTYVVLNPEWNIPESIADSEVVPKLVADPGYAARHGIEVVTESGERVPASSVFRREREEPDEAEAGGGFFAQLLGRADSDSHDEGGDDEAAPGTTTLPEGFRLRQAPGAANPLGQVKFMFPNEHNVYLHDTPAGSLFSRADRGFSHGCIRLEHPLELADYVLRGDSDWTPERIREAIASGERTEVRLLEELPVHLTYFTAWANDDGRVHFRDDLYGHDRRLAQALAAEEPLTLDPARLRGEPGDPSGG